MSDDATQITRLWTPQGFREDDWIHADGVEALAGNARVILPLPVFLAMDETERAAAAGRIGVHVLPGEAIDALVPHLASVPLVSLAFPAFGDGRSYSKAQLLRSRHGYGGTIRASGDVLIDQVALMLRTGFTEFEVSNPTALRRLAENRPGGLPFHSQPAADSAAAGAGYSWRRLPAA
jgi:uncharacterized protein (DUF934 family)